MKENNSNSLNTNILDTIELSKALGLAKKKSKDGQLGEAKKIYKDILQKFSKDKVALKELKLLDGVPAEERVEPSLEQLQSVIKLYTQGQIQKSLSIATKMMEIFPNSVTLFNIAGACNAGLMQFDAAIENYKKALKIKPDYADAYNNMGNVFQDQGNQEAALKSYKQAIKIKPDYADAYYNMGVTLKNKGNPEAAIGSYKQAIKIKPDYANAYNNMGTALQDQGNPEAALKSYKQAIKIKPDFANAFRNFSNVYRWTEHDEYFLKMLSLCQSSSASDEQLCHLNFALSKASEDLNEIEQSFHYLVRGNKLRKKILSYNIQQDIKLFSQIKKSHSSIALNSVRDASELKPIFIVGMPRSGTTLVEQIVSSHSKVTGAGELFFVERFGKHIVRGTVKPKAKMIFNFRQRYIEALKKRSGGRSIVTDKMPHNFLYVGLIFSAFPNAKVIHVNRDPAATCWSNYKQYFVSKGLGYSYDLDDTVRHFSLYRDLMEFWIGHYGDRIYNLNYDNLTINQEDETLRLIQYLGLKWEDDCLSPQHNKRSVRTASQQQVRQKVYQGSSQQWRKFESYLNGVFDQLTKFS